MRIKYLGHASFYLETNGVKIVFDPHDKIGYAFNEITADLALVSHNHYDHNNVGKVKGIKEVVTDGFVKFNGVQITSFFSYHDEVLGAKRGVNYIHHVFDGKVSYCHLGDFGQKPSDYDFSKLVGVDFLFLPVGGTYTVDASSAKEIVDSIRPKFVVPMHYKTELSTVDIASVDDFLRYYPTSKISVMKNDSDLSAILDEDFMSTRVLLFEMPDGQKF